MRVVKDDDEKQLLKMVCREKQSSTIEK